MLRLQNVHGESNSGSEAIRGSSLVSPETQALLETWTLSPATLATVILSGAIYMRGFLKLHVQMPRRFPRWRLAAFLGGLATIWLAVASPIDAFADLLLQVHMFQHLLLLFVAPPLILLGAPAIPMVRGLPFPIAHGALGPILKSRAFRRAAHRLSHPVVGLIALTTAMWTWHMPYLYQLALRSEDWHGIEHACFVAAATLFWWPVVAPWPSTPHWPRWAMIPYLLIADAQNTVLSAFLMFSGRVIYPFYAGVPRIGGITPLNDQIAAGAIMWVPASLFFLVPAAMIMLHMLAPQNLETSSAGHSRIHRPPIHI